MDTDQHPEPPKMDARALTPGSPGEPRWLAVALRPITEVRPGEAITALLLTLNVFLLLSAYYVIKPVREALILPLPSGAEYKSYMSGVIAVLLLFAVPTYAKFVDRLPRIKLVVGVTLFFALHLLLFFAAMKLGPSAAPRSTHPASSAAGGFAWALALVFYAWVGVFNMMVVAQFWSYANDIYDEERGNRLIPLVALGASVGAAAGSQLSAFLLPVVGRASMLLVAMVLLTCCAALFLVVERREGGSRPEVESSAVSTVVPDASGAFALVRADRYLLLVAAFSLLFSWANTNGEYMLGKLVKADAAAALASGRITDVSTHIGATYASFFFYVNVVGVFLQTFVVARLVKFLGFSRAFLIFPLIALGDAAAVALFPVLLAITIGKVAENSTDYSLNNTLRQTLWLVTSRDQKYKAKQAIDTFFVRAGDVSSALAVWIATAVLALQVRQFALLNVVLVSIWLVLALAIGRLHQRRTNQAQKGSA